jgi:hypothetical protein
MPKLLDAAFAYTAFLLLQALKKEENDPTSALELKK